MPAFSRQFKSSSPDTGNLRTTSLSGKLRSLSWAAIVPSAMFGRVTYFSSLTVVYALSIIIMTISWLLGGAAHLSATVPSSRTRGIYPANGKSEVSSSSIGSSLDRPFESILHLNCTDGHRRVERRCVRQQGSLLVVYVLPTFLSADVGSSLPSLPLDSLVSTGKSPCLLAIGCVHSRDARVHWRPW